MNRWVRELYAYRCLELVDQPQRLQRSSADIKEIFLEANGRTLQNSGPQRNKNKFGFPNRFFHDVGQRRDAGLRLDGGGLFLCKCGGNVFGV